MRRKGILAALFGAAVLMALGISAFAVAGDGKHHVKSDELTGYQEGAGLSVGGTGSFEAWIDDDAQTITYELRYSGLESPATQAHIHFGNRFTSGGISIWLCKTTQTAPPGTPDCPPGTTSEAVVTGEVAAANVVGPTAQGIPAGAAGFPEIAAALRSGVAYANVHTVNNGGGEIRGQINDANQKQP